jgi:hypothetical protein
MAATRDYATLFPHGDWLAIVTVPDELIERCRQHDDGSEGANIVVPIAELNAYLGTLRWERLPRRG